jgi:pimeloyl-ACP methyl ester carboxylesterase
MAKTSRPTRAPNKALYLTDYARSAWDIGALSTTLPALARAPRGDGHAVLVIPGLGASDMSTLILRRFLSTLGYATYGWELGRNIGPTARVVRGLPERLHEFRARHDGPVSVIGRSLGGIFARQLGRRHPDVIRQVITLASPIRLKDHEHSNARRAYELLEKRHTETIQLPLEAGLEPLPVPATSVYTRLDGIVAWRACLDQPSRHAENVEVYASHFGIGNHPAALWVIADRLTQAPGKWAPFRPPPRWRGAYPTPIATDPVDPS